MAVVQISKIQVRRGQKNQGTGIPQLASGEFGWAVDTQELYIGNGAVSEGAPAVGNTQILTNESNIFELADRYSYNQDIGYIQTGINDNTYRNLQDKLDDFVSAADFGMTGDSTQDVTELLQNALDQLYINPVSKGTETSRVTLYFPAGIYTVSNTIYVPPHAKIVGQGSENTIIRNTGSQDYVFVTVNLDSTPGSPANASTTTTVNQCKDILFKEISLETQTANNILRLENCKDGIFNNVTFVGAWSNTDGIDSDGAGIDIINRSASVASINNRFYNCYFKHLPYAVYSDWDANDNLWKDCIFYDLGQGLSFGEGVVALDSSSASGIKTGASNNRIENCTFTDISQQGINFVFGKDNVSESNTFRFVGNDQGAEYESAFPIITFGSNFGTNHSIQDYFYRQNILGADPAYIGYEYRSEIEGNVKHSSRNNLNVYITASSTYVPKFRLPADVGVTNQQYLIRYILKSQSYSAIRSGELRITVNGITDEVTLSDSYDYLGDINKETAILFQAAVSSINAVDHINVNVKSSMPGDDITEFVYSLELLK